MLTPRIRDIARDQETIRQVDEAVRADDIPRAVDLSRKALVDGLEHPMLYNLRSYWFEQQGRLKEALADIERAVAMAPDHFTVQNAYGIMLAKLSHGREAVAAFRRATELAPEFAPAHFNLGWSNEGIGAIEEAERNFERTVELEPRHAHAMAYLADLAYRRGDWAQAGEWADRSLAIDPNRHLAIATRARVAIAQKDLEKAEYILAHVADNVPVPRMEQAMLSGILGELRHEQGRYAEAFAAHTAANTLKKTLFAHYDTPGRENTATHLAWLLEYFRTAPAEQWKARRHGAPDPDDDHGGAAQHVLLVGFPRSGTTLLENILSSHPGVVALEEKELMGPTFRAFMTHARGRAELAQARSEDLQKHRAHYWESVRGFGIDVKGKVFIDKHPLSSIRLMLVAKLFPRAKILFAVRDPRDVVLSCYRRSYMMNFSMFEFLTLERAATFYDGTMELSKIEHEKMGLDWHWLRHEALVENFEAEVRKVCDFIGLDWAPEMNDFAEHAKSRHIATPSALQVMKGLNSGSVGAWRNYKEQLAPILPMLAPWVKHYGYPED
jgi:Tfp pilus assembly protein PilF